MVRLWYLIKILIQPDHEKIVREYACIDSFYRFGVEHGKVCSDQMEPLLAKDVTETDKDASTDGLLQFIR